MIPGLAYLFINNYIPMVGVLIAFKKMDYRLGMFRSPWIGLKNFEFLFTSNDAWLMTRNTIGYNLLFIAIGTAASIAVAILLFSVSSDKLKNAYQMSVLLPYTISIVIVSYLVYGFLNTDTGFINKSILSALGIQKIFWYMESRYWPYILTIVYLWRVVGYNSVIYYATLVGVDKQYFEASAIDGAGSLKQIQYIILPSLRPTMITLILLAISRIFYSDFGLFYQIPMDSGPLYDVTQTIDTYVFRGLMRLNNIGMSSAAGFYQSIVGFALVLSANLVVKKFDEDNSLF
jgi:putative aldouronate transport system permease protein